MDTMDWYVQLTLKPKQEQQTGPSQSCTHSRFHWMLTQIVQRFITLLQDTVAQTVSNQLPVTGERRLVLGTAIKARMLLKKSTSELSS